jgi:hypothetical protein
MVRLTTASLLSKALEMPAERPIPFLAPNVVDREPRAVTRRADLCSTSSHRISRFWYYWG